MMDSATICLKPTEKHFHFLMMKQDGLLIDYVSLLFLFEVSGSFKGSGNEAICCAGCMLSHCNAGQNQLTIQKY